MPKKKDGDGVPLPFISYDRMVLLRATLLSAGDTLEYPEAVKLALGILDGTGMKPLEIKHRK